MQTFEKDLDAGKELEEYILKKIKKKYSDAYIIDGYFKEYDIYIPQINLGVEVKRDEKSRYTGNYVIEVEFDGKPSALSTTKADYWVIYDGECEVWTTPLRIKKSVKGLPLREFIGKVDIKPKKAYLCPKKLIKKNAEVVYEVYR
jgi:hypothetical protein